MWRRWRGTEKSADAEPKAPAYPVQVADTENWELTLYKHELVDSKEEGKKDIVLYYHYKNKSTRPLVYSDSVNAHYMQGDENLWFARMSDTKKQVEPGETYDVEVAYTLENLETPVSISVGGFTSAVTRTEWTVNIK